MSQRPPLSTHPIKTLPEKIFPLLSPLGQKMVLGILFLPVLFFLATGAWLDFSLKPPVLSSLSGVTRVLYDLHSILRSLSYIKSLKESPLLSENISRIAGYREQIQATVKDIRQDTSIFTDKDMERLSLLEKASYPIHLPRGKTFPARFGSQASWKKTANRSGPERWRSFTRSTFGSPGQEEV